MSDHDATDAGLLRGLVEFAGILALMTALTFFFLGAGRNHEPRTTNQEPKNHEQEN